VRPFAEQIVHLKQVQ